VSDFWLRYGLLQERISGGEFEAALSMIRSTPDFWKEDPSLIATVESQCLRSLARSTDAYQLLYPFAERDDSNLWVYHSFGSLAYELGFADQAAHAYQTFHEKLGWPESKSKGYYFTHDYFANNIPQWSLWFKEVITQDPISCLEIGSWQGGSSTWLLDHVISKRSGSSLICIDTFEGSSEHASFIGSVDVEKLFDDNIKRTGHQSSVKKIKGYSQEALRTMEASLDFVYIDGAHEAKFVIQDALLSWRMLNKNGFMLFDDYPFAFSETPVQNTAVAID
jgi:hypothetical protein